MGENKQLLDPLGTLCRLISLNFMEVNTKISIQDHIIKLQKPTYLQSIMRTINGDGRENISELFYCVIRFIKWYLNPQIENPNDINMSDEIKIIASYVCVALKRLQSTYEFGNVIFAIQYYINILQAAINEHMHDDMIPICINDKEKEYHNLLDYDKIKNFWDLKKVKRVCELYKNCFNMEKELDVSPQEKIALSEGYIKSIYSILDITDKEFQQLIQNSNKG